MIYEESLGYLFKKKKVKGMGNQYLFINTYVSSTVLGVFTWLISFNHISLGSQVHLRNIQRVGT